MPQGDGGAENTRILTDLDTNNSQVLVDQFHGRKSKVGKRGARKACQKS
jgi:hypothetical protein